MYFMVDLAELKTMLTLSTITPLYNGHVLNQFKFILWFVKLFSQYKYWPIILNLNVIYFVHQHAGSHFVLVFCHVSKSF